MLKGLLIYDPKDWNFVTSLSELLKLVGEGSDITWHIYQYDGLFIKNPSDKTLDMYNKLEANPEGLYVSWEEMNEFAENIFQIFDGSFYAVRKYEGKYYCLLSIEMFDSFYWKIFTSIEGLYEKLKASLPVDQFLDENSTYPKIPVPHSHLYKNTPAGIQMRGPPQKEEGWDYGSNE